MKNNICIYIHWPWCNNICKYCDYYKFKNIKSIHYKTIFDSYVRDLKVLEEYFYDKPITSIHVGGGTPSIMENCLLENILEYIFKKNTIAKNLEVSLEANPDDITCKKLKKYKDIGVNRLSIGVQSFSNETLKYLGRTHNKEQAINSVLNGAEYLKNIGIDLISNTPLFKKNDFENQLIFARELPIKHISIYEFYYQNISKEFGVLDKKYLLKNYKKILEEKKFFLYEINSFSKARYKSRYNSSVMGMKNYIGIGPSSQGRVCKESYFIKLKNTKNLTKWMNPNINPYQKRVLSKENAIEEFLLLGLSKSEGISIKELLKLTNHEVSKYIDLKNISILKKKKLLFEDKNRLFLNEKGMLLINSILSNILLTS